MTDSTKPKVKLLTLLKSSMLAPFENKAILFPFIIIFLISIICIEILYFFPRWPLSEFFGPLIRTARWGGEGYMHYPANLILVPQLFQSLQMPLYILVNSFFIGAAILIIATINNEKRVVFKSVWKETLQSYFQLIIAAALIFFLADTFTKLYDYFLVARALKIRSESGIYFMIKAAVLHGMVYFKLLLSILATTIFAYVLPAIVIERKKIFSALIWNFRTLWKSFWTTFFIILIPSLLIVPVLLLSTSIDPMRSIPELSVVMLILTVFMLTAIDVIIYTALTTYYLVKKEDQ